MRLLPAGIPANVRLPGRLRRIHAHTAATGRRGRSAARIVVPHPLRNIRDRRVDHVRRSRRRRPVRGIARRHIGRRKLRPAHAGDILAASREVHCQRGLLRRGQIRSRHSNPSTRHRPPPQITVCPCDAACASTAFGSHSRWLSSPVSHSP